MAADAGVDDVELIAANALHRRMTAAELKHIVGERVFRSFYPQGELLQLRRRGPRQPRPPRHHRQGRGHRDQQAGRRVRPARLRQRQPRRHGRRPQVGAASGWRRTSRCGTTTTPRRWSTRGRSWTTSTPRCTTRPGGWARVIKDHVKVFQIETTLNNDVFPKPYDFLQKREWEWSVKDQASMLAVRRGARASRRRSCGTRCSTTCARSTASPASTPARSRPCTSGRWRRCTSSTSSRCRASPTCS